MLYRLGGWILRHRARSLLIGSLMLALGAIAHLVLAAIVFIGIAESAELRRSAVGASLLTARDASSELDHAKTMLISAALVDSPVGATGIVLGLYGLTCTHRRRRAVNP